MVPARRPGRQGPRHREEARRATAGRNTTEKILGDLKQSFGLSVLVLRDAAERILAAVPPGLAPALIPEVELTPDILLPSDGSRLRVGVRGLRLPEGGGRLRLGSDGDLVSLDLWEGDAQGFGLEESRTLTIAVSILGLELSRRTGAARAAIAEEPRPASRLR